MVEEMWKSPERLIMEAAARDHTVHRYLYGATKEDTLAHVNTHPELRLVGIYKDDKMGLWVAECQFLNEKYRK